MKKRGIMQKSAALMTFVMVSCACNTNGGFTLVANADEGDVIKEWNFDDGIGGWQNAGWDYQYSGNTATTSWNEEAKALAVAVDFSNEADNSWSQIGVQEWGEVDLVGVSKTTFDFYYKDEEMSSGGFTIKEVLQYESDGSYPSAVEEYVDVDLENATLIENGDLAGYKKAQVTVSFDSIEEDICNTVFCIVGKNTTYKGAIYLDNIRMVGKEESADDKKEDISVDSTIEVKENNLVTVADNTFKAATGNSATIPSNVKLVDAKASDAAKQIYSYLYAVGNTNSLIYGHQDDTWQKAGNKNLSESDTKDVTGSNAGVLGIDTLSLTGNEYSASRYNSELAETAGLEKVETGSCMAKANVEAAAKMTNYNIRNGAIVTLSAHMPNFSVVSESSSYNPETDPSYAKYDFAGYTPNTLTGDVANEILPGGIYNEKYNAFLDMIADYASQVDGAIIFRPFHECTGSWFWWGAAFCDEEQYKNIFRYAVTYLRDEKDIHNIIYAYGPGSEAASVEDYSLRYPGDEYVDLVGFDMYDSDPKTDEEGYDFITNFKRELGIVESFAASHGKLIAVTETGLATSNADKGDNQTVLHKTGNNQKDWYLKMLDATADSKACYMLLWANFGKRDGYYTPYVDSVNEDGSLHGHEMLDNFIKFYNDERTIFADDQKEALEKLNNISVKTGAINDTWGYITAPVAGKRILSETQFEAVISKNAKKATFEVNNGADVIKLDGVIEGNSAKATCDEKTLKKIGKSADGKLTLIVDGKPVQTIKLIFNIEEPAEDPYEIDGFENYYGVDTMLTAKWATNKASGSSITLSHTKELGYDGTYAMKFDYKETSNGWAGATISKEVDWSDCDTLSFVVVPDGKNQKTVVQITANNTVYETYLNLYDDYAKDVDNTPLLVKIPFADFCQRDTAGNPKGGLLTDRSAVTSFGLWVNAISDSPFIDEEGYVSGTLIYDKITAEKTGIDKASFEPVKGVSGSPETVTKPSTSTNSMQNGSNSTNGASSSKDIRQVENTNTPKQAKSIEDIPKTPKTIERTDIAKTVKNDSQDTVMDISDSNEENSNKAVDETDDKTETADANEKKLEDEAVPAYAKSSNHIVVIIIGVAIAVLALGVAYIIRWKKA